MVACISPWNLPLYLLTWKVAPALAAGNCVIAKPSELTPMTAVENLFFRYRRTLGDSLRACGYESQKREAMIGSQRIEPDG